MDGQQGALEIKYKSKQITGKSVRQKLDGSSLYKRLQGNGLPPYQNGYSQSSIHEGKDFLGVPEKEKNSRVSGFNMHTNGQKNFGELLKYEKAEWDLESGSPVVEKTLYIDSIHTDKSPNTNSISEKCTDIKGTPSIDSSLQDSKCSSSVNEKALTKTKSSESFESCFMSCSDRSTHDIQMDVMKSGSRHDEDLFQDCITLKSSKVADQESFDLGRRHTGKLGCQEDYCALNEDSLSLASLKEGDDKKIDTENKNPMEFGDKGSPYAHKKDPVTLKSSRTAVDKKINSERPGPIKSGSEESSDALIQSSITKVATDEKIDLENQGLVKLGSQESAHGGSLQMPLGLLLPKSPSESWLKRTLPTISSRNSSSRSSLAARPCVSSHVSKTSMLDPKWETIVKTSNAQTGHLRFSEVIRFLFCVHCFCFTGIETKFCLQYSLFYQELLTPIPEA